LLNRFATCHSFSGHTLEAFVKVTFLTALAVLWAAGTCAAQSLTPLDAKLGLWESAVSTDIPGRSALAATPQIPESALARMAPEQRAQMEAMMKARSGGAPITTRMCLTRESLASGGLGQRDKSCTTKVVSSSSTQQVVHVECVREEVKSSGDMTVQVVDPQHIKGTMVMKSTVAGQTRDMKMSFENKWVSADCGTVKPAGAK
jgi:hypothetical protein